MKIKNRLTFTGSNKKWVYCTWPRTEKYTSSRAKEVGCLWPRQLLEIFLDFTREIRDGSQRIMISIGENLLFFFLWHQINLEITNNSTASFRCVSILFFSQEVPGNTRKVLEFVCYELSVWVWLFLFVCVCILKYKYNGSRNNHSIQIRASEKRESSCYVFSEVLGCFLR